jgi:hypothetical protein
MSLFSKVMMLEQVVSKNLAPALFYLLQPGAYLIFRKKNYEIKMGVMKT